MRILTSNSEGILAKKRTNNINIFLGQTKDELRHLNMFGTLDQDELFEKEKKHCKRYRLVVTIKPFCTNVLFNPLSEMVYHEGADDQVVFTDNPTNLPNELHNNVIGLKHNIDRTYLIENTEYSSNSVGVDYHIGYDFLNNHILRNKTNKAVCPPQKGDTIEKFNTIEDLMRTSNGKIHRFRNRFSHDGVDQGGVSLTNADRERHLYDIDDLYRYEDNELDTLIVRENGWYGVSNATNVKVDGKGSEFNRTINSKEACSFIDFYPDRSLFSFTPKFNDHRDRYEHNWDYIVAYPYRKIFNHEIVKKGDFNSLRVTSVSIDKVSSAYTGLKVYTEINANITEGSIIDLILVTDTNEMIVAEEVRVSRVLPDNSIYIDSIDTLSSLYPRNVDIYNLSLDDIELINTRLGTLSFRLRRKYNFKPVQYYIKTLHKLANDEFSKQDYTSGESVSKYFEEHCTDANGNLHDFNKEVYNFGFAKTIFNDAVSQVYFSDEINMEYITDDTLSPIEAFYFGIIKTNKGHDEWYSGDFNNPAIEYSHAFGKLTSCLHTKTPVSEVKKLLVNYDFRLVNNLNLFSSKHIEEDISSLGGINKNEFMYAVCEYSPEEQKETILSEIQYRFNTKQRELGDDRKKQGLFVKSIFKDIKKDDMDFGGFEVTSVDNSTKTFNKDNKTINYLDRPEGYYYKPFYEVKIADKSKYPKTVFNQTMGIEELDIIDGHVKIQTKNVHRLKIGYIVEVHNKDNHSESTRLLVTDTYSVNLFRCRILDGNKKNLLTKDNVFTTLNPVIPPYADKIDYRTYVYSPYNYFDNNIIQYKNLRNYVSLGINFFLHRQDTSPIDSASGLHIKYDVPGYEKVSELREAKDIILDDYGC